MTQYHNQIFDLVGAVIGIVAIPIILTKLSELAPPDYAFYTMGMFVWFVDIAVAGTILRELRHEIR